MTCGQFAHGLVWDLESGELLQELEGPVGSLVAVTFTEDESHIVGAAIDKHVYLWKTTGELVHTLTGHTAAVWDVACVPGRKEAVSVGADKIVRRWDLATGSELKQYAGHNINIGHVDVSRDGKLIATSSHDGTVRVWNLETAEQLSVFAGHKKAVQGVVFTADGRAVLSGDYNGVLCLSDSLTGEELWRVQGHNDVLGDVALTADGLHMLSAGHDKFVRVARLPDTGRLPRLARHLGEHDEWVMSAAFRPHGDLVATVGADEVIRLWHLQSGEMKAELKDHAADVRSIHFSTDGKTFVTASHDRTIKVWDAEKLTVQQTLSGHNDVITAAVLLPGEKRLVSSSDDKTLILWDIAEAKPLHLLEFRGAVSCLALASDGKTLASSGKDNQVVISEVVGDKIELRRRLPGHKAEVRGLAFTPNGSQLVSSSRDGTVCVWNVRDGQRTAHARAGDRHRLQRRLFAQRQAPGGRRRRLDARDREGVRLRLRPPADGNEQFRRICACPRVRGRQPDAGHRGCGSQRQAVARPQAAGLARWDRRRRDHPCPPPSRPRRARLSTRFDGRRAHDSLDQRRPFQPQVEPGG